MGLLRLDVGTEDGVVATITSEDLTEKAGKDDREQSSHRRNTSEQVRHHCRAVGACLKG